MLEYKRGVRVLTFNDGDEAKYAEALRAALDRLAGEIELSTSAAASMPLLVQRGSLHHLLLALTDGRG